MSGDEAALSKTLPLLCDLQSIHNWDREALSIFLPSLFRWLSRFCSLFSLWLLVPSFLIFFFTFLRGGLSFFVHIYIYIYINYFSPFSLSSPTTLFFHISLTRSFTSILSLSLSLSLSLTPPPSLPPWPQGRTADRLCTPAAQGLFLRSICPSPSLWRLTQPNNISSAHAHMCTLTHTHTHTHTHGH